MQHQVLGPDLWRYRLDQERSRGLTEAGCVGDCRWRQIFGGELILGSEPHAECQVYGGYSIDAQ